jgi:hypothetical protein
MLGTLLRLLISIICLAFFTSLVEVSVAASHAPQRMTTRKAFVRPETAPHRG